jgi:Mg/Co/Ni transporter MgtE
MLAPDIQRTLDDPITRHMRTEFAQLHIDQTIGDALSAIRANPPSSRVTSELLTYPLDYMTGSSG